MIIFPTSNLWLLQGVPVNNEYRDTLLFSTAQKQSEYFKSKCPNPSVYHWDDMTYIKASGTVDGGALKVPLSQESLYGFNYMMFQNNGTTGKRFIYAFINQIEYVNTECSLLHFQIDVMQTWFLFSCERRHCYVVREHSLSDAIGANTKPEAIDTGVSQVGRIYRIEPSAGHTQSDNISYVVFATRDKSDNTAGGVIGGQYTGLTCSYFSSSQINFLNDWLEYLIKNNKISEVVSILCVPDWVIPYNKSTGKFEGAYKKHTISVPRPTTLNNGYVPKNKKLFTFPYCFLSVDGGNTATVLKYENFNNPNSIKFEIDTAFSPNPTATCFPLNYDGLEGRNNVKSTSISGFPQCSFAIDSYNAYLAMQSTNPINALFGGGESGILYGSALQGAISGLGKGRGFLSSIANTATGAVAGAANSWLEMKQAEMQPNSLAGGQTSDVETITRMKHFEIRQIEPKVEYCKMIDDFFTMYGYSTLAVKIPNIGVRKNFCYVKTEGCNVQGICPQDDLRQINNIFDNGVTFWKEPDNVGNYSVDNTPDTTIPH